MLYCHRLHNKLTKNDLVSGENEYLLSIMSHISEALGIHNCFRFTWELSQVAQWQRIYLLERRQGFNSCVRKIPWRRKRQPTPYSCLGNPMDRGAWGVHSMGSQRVGDNFMSKQQQTENCIWQSWRRRKTGFSFL